MLLALFGIGTAALAASVVQVSYSDSWCFKPSQPRMTISELRETFVKRYIVERTNKAENAME